MYAPSLSVLRQEQVKLKPSFFCSPMNCGRSVLSLRSMRQET